MDNLTAARAQMAISLGFHIVFACIGMTMPWLMAFAEWRYLRTGRKVYQNVAEAWARGVAVFFAVGAVSGTVLSFELGLLWPGFMKHAGPIIGMPFSWEGTAFFIEAIAIGLFLYGREKLPPRVHFASGLAVGISGVASGVLVVSANAWMNSPTGFRWVDGRAVDIDPVAAMFNDAWASQALHMTLAAFVSTSFAVAGVHAYRLLKSPGCELHQTALRIALVFGAVTALLQPLSGDLSAKDVAARQPVKLAAMEALYKTQAGAPLLLGGIPDDDTEQVRYGVEIPGALSFMLHEDFEAEVKGLDAVPKDERPKTLVVHLAFQVMVGSGMALAAVALLFGWLRLKKQEALSSRWFLWVVAATTPLGFLAVEAGWTVTEVGRQPWIIYGVLRTQDAVTPMPGMAWPLVGMLVVYGLLTLVTSLVLRRLILQAETAKSAETNHG